MIVGPGLVMAATGVGAGDFAASAVTGAKFGLALLWILLVGAAVKFMLTEGLARWQMATGETLLEGWVHRLGRWIRWLFLAYLLIWTVFTSGALMNACGVAGTGLFPLTDDLRLSKILWGVLHSAVGLVLVWVGGFRLFERMMSACIAVMFVTVMVTVVLIRPDWSAVAHGLAVPTIPEGGLGYILGVLGGVGGTVTLMSYGYWAREIGRRGAAGLRSCRIDLAVGYTMTALFGIAMVVIGSRVSLERGPTVALELAGQLGDSVGPVGKWIFLAGFWGAVFSSLLGVWQSVPYLFADFFLLSRGDAARANGDVDFARTVPYRVYLVLIAVVPLPLLWWSVERAQLSYAILGSLFMPLLAVTLLLMNNREGWVGKGFKNGWLANAVLVVTVLFFGYAALRKAQDVLGKLMAG